MSELTDGFDDIAYAFDPVNYVVFDISHNINNVSFQDLPEWAAGLEAAARCLESLLHSFDGITGLSRLLVKVLTSLLTSFTKNVKYSVQTFINAAKASVILKLKCPKEYLV